MSQYRKILLIVDPSLKPTPAYRRAVRLAQTTGAELQLCLFDYSSAIAVMRFVDQNVMEVAQGAYIRERQEKLNDACLELKEQGLKVCSEVVWHSPVHEAIVSHVFHHQPDLVIKDVRREPLAKRLPFTPLDWHLLRLCPAPLLMVNGASSPITRRVIAAVDTVQAEPTAATLNEEVVRAALEFALQCSAELHLVHAFEGNEVFLFPELEAAEPSLFNLYEELRSLDTARFEKFAAQYGVPDNRKHVLLGSAAEAIVEYASDSAADVVVIGAVHRTGLERIIMGSTAERTLAQIACDVLVIKPDSFSADLARHLGLKKSSTVPPPSGCVPVQGANPGQAQSVATL